MLVTVDEHAVLALYTPPHDTTTRSVLLCRVPRRAVVKQEETTDATQQPDAARVPLFEPLGGGENVPDEYLMIDNLPLALVVTVPLAVDEDALVKFMLASYGFMHYGAEKAQEARDAYNACDDARAVLPRLREIDDANEAEYDEYRDSLRRARYRDDVELQGGANVRFVRTCRRFKAVGRDFAGEAQYRLTLDNHRVLMYFVRRFRRSPIKCDGVEYRVRLMSPLLNQHALWASQCAEHYVECQLNARENPDFVQSLAFDNPTAVLDGLISPALFPINYARALSDNDARNALAVARQDLPHNTSHYVSQLGYCQFYVRIDLESPRELALWGCDYRERQERLGYVPPSAVGPVKKKKAASEPTVRAQKRKPNDQPTLGGFMALQRDLKEKKARTDAAINLNQ